MSIMTKTGVDENGNEAEVVSSGYVGEIKMFGYAGVPEHCLACDGSLLSIAAYPELYAKLGTQHGGDGVTTFALPTAEDVIYAAGNGRTVGASIADGLPNIIGAWQFRVGDTTTSNGVVVASTYRDALMPVLVDPASHGTSVAAQLTNTVVPDDIANVGIRLDASWANAIYGASQHVQPKGTAFNFCVVYE